MRAALFAKATATTETGPSSELSATVERAGLWQTDYQLCDGKIPKNLGIFLPFALNKPARIIRAPCLSSFGRQGDEGNLLELHPTVKPIN